MSIGPFREMYSRKVCDMGFARFVLSKTNTLVASLASLLHLRLPQDQTDRFSWMYAQCELLHSGCLVGRNT